MALADALALAELYDMLGLVDNEPLERFYREQLYALAQSPYLVDASIIDVSPNTGVFAFPEAAIQLLDVWYDNRSLDFMTRQALASISPTWETERGAPVAYTTESVSARTFKVYPIPTEPSNPFIPVFFEPLGRDYPGYNVVLIATQFHTDPPPWMELPLLLSALGREFQRESSHKDQNFAEGCKQIAAFIERMYLPPKVL